MMGAICTVAKHYTPSVVYVATLNNPLGSGKDDTSAINTTLTNANKAGGGNVHAPGGNTWNFGSSTHISVPANVTLMGDGDNSIFNSTSPTIMAIYLNGNNSGLAKCLVQSSGYSATGLVRDPNGSGTPVNTGLSNSKGQNPGYDGSDGNGNTPRLSSIDGHMVYVSPGVATFTISHVHTIGGRSGGIFVDGATKGTIDTCTVEYAWADGIGLYSGGGNTTVNNCTVTGCGDDGISIVPYANPSPTGMIVQGCTVQTGYWGRGITDVGANGALFQNNHVNTYFASGLMADQDTPATNGPPPTNGTWNGNFVNNTPNNTSGYAGAYMLFRNVTGYHITNNTATNLQSTTQAFFVDSSSTKGYTSGGGNSPASSNPPW